MNPVELFKEDGSSTGVYYCGNPECRLVHRELDRAEQCCAPYKCNICGVETSRYSLRCSSCRAKVEAEKERIQFADAEKVAESEWDGWVYCEGTGNDGYSESVDALREYLEDEDKPLPLYVWACDESHFVQASIHDIFGCMEGDAYPDFEFDLLDGIPELKAALDKFNKVNTKAVSFQPNYKKAVLLSEPVIHGETCIKVAHVGTGYLHGEDDDRPYDVDGVSYCGRCHFGL